MGERRRTQGCVIRAREASACVKSRAKTVSGGVIGGARAWDAIRDCVRT